MRTTRNLLHARAFMSVQVARLAAQVTVPPDRLFRIATYQLEDRTECHVVEIQDGAHVVYLGGPEPCEQSSGR
jgi:hypothetical protein